VKVVHMNSLKLYTKGNIGANRLTVLMEGDSDDRDEVEGRKLVGEGTCSGLCKAEMDVVVKEYQDTLLVNLGRLI